jgi:hypothetical protein
MEIRERLRDGNAFDDEVIWGEVERLFFVLRTVVSIHDVTKALNKVTGLSACYTRKVITVEKANVEIAINTRNPRK